MLPKPLLLTCIDPNVLLVSILLVLPVCRYGNASVWKTFTDLFDYFPLTALVSIFVPNLFGLSLTAIPSQCYYVFSIYILVRLFLSVIVYSSYSSQLENEVNLS